MDLSMEKGLFSVLAVFWEQGQSVHHDNFYPCLLNDAAGKFIGVFAFMYDADDACIDEHFGADDAGLKCDVYGAAFCADADFCRLYDGVLFGVQCAAELMPLAGRDAQTFAFTAADFRTMAQAGRCAVIACCYDTVFADNDRADLPAKTGGGFFYDFRYLHKLLVQAYSHFYSS